MTSSASRTESSFDHPPDSQTGSDAASLSTQTGSSWDSWRSPEVTAHLSVTCPDFVPHGAKLSRTSLLPASLPPLFTLHLLGCFKIVVAVRFTRLTDSSGCGWLWLAPPPMDSDPHCPAVPPGDSRALCPLCCVLCSPHHLQILCGIYCFIFFYFHDSLSRSERFQPFLFSFILFSPLLDSKRQEAELHGASAFMCRTLCFV